MQESLRFAVSKSLVLSRSPTFVGHTRTVLKKFAGVIAFALCSQLLKSSLMALKGEDIVSEARIEEGVEGERNWLVARLQLLTLYHIIA